VQFYYTPNLKKRQFQFQNQQIANTPYHLIKAYPEQGVVKQSDYENINKKAMNCKGHNSFECQLERGDFVKNMKGVNPNEKRFGLGQNYDKS
jgi:hypothetical protein